MSRKIKLLICSMTALFTSAIICISPQGAAHAGVIASNEVAKKALLQDVSYCYMNGDIKDSVPSLMEFNDFSTQINDTKGNNYLAFPSGLTKLSDNTGSCADLFLGFPRSSQDQVKSVFSLFGRKYKGFSNNDDYKEKRTFLEGMGYTKQDTSGNCIAFEYDDEFYTQRNAKLELTTSTAYTDNVCVKDGVFSTSSYTKSSFGGANRVPIAIHLSSDKTTITQLNAAHGSNKDGGDTGKIVVDTEISANDPDWQTKLKQAVSGKFTYLSESGGGNIVAARNNGFYSYKHDQVNGEGESYYKIVEDRRNGKWGDAADKAIKYISGGAYADRASLKFSDAEQLSYYIQVVREWFYDGEEDKDSYWLCNTNGIDWNDYYNYDKPIKRTPSGELGECRIALSEAKKDKGDAFGFKDGYFDSSKGITLSLSAVIDEINRLSDEVGDEEISDVSSENTSEVKDPCLDSQVADNLGWIICPIMNMARDAADGLYNDFVEPALSIEPQLFSENNNINQGPTHDAWAVFQGFANIGFTILFLVVIFSQLTGVGIDNYGIKKILPKLIIAAVLVNLSYIICIICVDLSNILGSSLQDMFTSIPVYTNNTAHGVSADSIGSTILTAVPIATGIIAAWYLITPAILLGLLISVIGLIISLLFLFLLLAGREAAIVVLTVISPLAFLCYMLPNTKKLFDKWLKIWEGLLLVYPIAGLLMGGGNFVSRLLVAINGIPKENYDTLTDNTSNGSFFTAFAAMMISIVPIFFIPTVLKGAFSALGNIGGKLAGLGSALSGKTTGAIRKSDAYKNAKQRSAEWKTERRAGIGKDVKNMSALQRAMHGIAIKDSAVARNRAAHIDNQKAKGQLDKYLDNSYMKGAQIELEDKQRDEAIDRQLALMKRSGINGKVYNNDNARDRIIALGGKTNLNDSDKLELAALSRGLANEVGGGGKLAKTIRDVNNGDSGINSNFMSAMGEIYAKDSKVRSKLNEKDNAASELTEKFLPNSNAADHPTGSFNDFREANKSNINKRSKTYAQGLNQSDSSGALGEYIDTLNLDDINHVKSDKSLLSNLDSAAIDKINAREQVLLQQQQQPGGNTGQDNGGTQRAKVKPISAENIPEGIKIVHGGNKRR